MNIESFLKIIECEIKNKHKTQIKAATFLNIDPKSFNANLKNLRENKGIRYNTLKKIMNGLGYEIYVRKIKKS